MYDLITVDFNNERPMVSGRELYTALEIKTRYNDWFRRMCEYGFIENIDFKAITQKRVTAQGNKITQIDHQFSISMAKEVCMIQRNEKGKKLKILNLKNFRSLMTIFYCH